MISVVIQQKGQTTKLRKGETKEEKRRKEKFHIDSITTKIKREKRVMGAKAQISRPAQTKRTTKARQKQMCEDDLRCSAASREGAGDGELQDFAVIDE